MQLRPYTPEDLDNVVSLFYKTVHQICSAAYTPAQLNAWAPARWERQRWEDLLSGKSGHQVFLAEEEGVLAGFATLCLEESLLDHLYVSADFQRKGVATLLADHIETLAREAGLQRLHTEASLVARGFFEKRGYRVLLQQQVERRGQLLTNFVMEKII